jgi:4a-hydroxytetrahydrobiopterin dehydratase
MWNKSDSSLTRTFEFKSFNDAISFMQDASVEIDQLNHHPEWSNVYNRVEVKLTTHDAGNKVTEKDHKLAAILDEVYCQYE